MMRKTLLAASVLSCLGLNAQATDLLQVWQATVQHDPQGQVIAATRGAGAARRDEASALWRPNVALNATAGVASADTRMNGAQFSAPGFGTSSGVSFGTSVGDGNATRWSLNARQPLYNPERQAQREQLNLAADAAELASQAAQQDWMLQTAQRYFELYLTRQQVQLVERQKAAVDRALAEAKDRYDIGDAPITDMHEAAARARALDAQWLAAQASLESQRQALAETTGLAADPLEPIGPTDAAVDAAQVEPLDHWLAQVKDNNPALRLAQVQADSAQAETGKHRLAGSATVDLIAQASRERLSGSGDFGSASNTQTQRMIGVTLNLPLYTGGGRQAKLAESLQLQDKARAEADKARLDTVQRTRATWLNLQTAPTRLQALQAALTASQARLDATRTGHQVGDRTTLDLLNAENDASAAEWALAQARVDTLLNRLQLDALAGQLNEQRLQHINAHLQH